MLTDRQRKFLGYYLSGPTKYNAYRSALLAGYACPRQQGPRLTHFPNVAAAIDEAMELEWSEMRLHARAMMAARHARS